MIKNDWQHHLLSELSKEYYIQLNKTLINEYKKNEIFPPYNDIFNALNYTSYQNTKVVILGQDPYHKKGQAHGLSFSVNKGVKIPPSLRNIYKELSNDLGLNIPNNGYLKKWCKQGVLLLNTALTVVEASPNSHKDIGWSIFTDKIISILNEKKSPIVFILWGNNAIAKHPLITNKRHLILKSKHPSPLSAHAGFFGNKHFSTANEFLHNNNLGKIDWQIDDI